MLTAAYEPLTLGPITLPNRFIKAGANENMSKQGRPTRAMRMHHEALVKGGVGMTTMAYVAVEKDGRTLPDQVWIHDDAMPDLRAVVLQDTSKAKCKKVLTKFAIFFFKQTKNHLKS